MSTEAGVYLALLVASWLVIAGLIVAVLRQARVIRATQRRLQYANERAHKWQLAHTTSDRLPSTWSEQLVRHAHLITTDRCRCEDCADVPDPPVPAPRRPSTEEGSAT